ncbi:hypothetical protein J7L36_01765 [bacterium]|nr:hypothetical protein [bacterium]
MPEKRTYRQRAKYLIKAVKKRRKKLKAMAVEYKGGKCAICGYNKCLDCLVFHRLNPEEKDFGLSTKGLTRSWEKIKRELDKCILLCVRCHCELHAGELQLPRAIVDEKRGEMSWHHSVQEPES